VYTLATKSFDDLETVGLGRKRPRRQFFSRFVKVRFRSLDIQITIHTRCPRTRAPEKKGEIFIKEQINNPNEKFFYVERYSRKEQFDSINQSILSHPGLFPVIVARLHILLRFQ
jgi:hypothetical protein